MAKKVVIEFLSVRHAEPVWKSVQRFLLSRMGLRLRP